MDSPNRGSKEFTHQYTLMRHLPTHTDERKFQCNTCGKAFRQMSTLSQHRAIHSTERPYICEVCQKTFNRVSTLISHRKTHTGLKPHRCHLCTKAFHQKDLIWIRRVKAYLDPSSKEHLSRGQSFTNFAIVGSNKYKERLRLPNESSFRNFNPLKKVLEGLKKNDRRIQKTI
ncbi:hypothetical protein NQ318_016152 [Aromia moschata]|uniref:C2H2-type domain-containing protein n=1 Tax=Aromia moschata TaxID=1265417 RepID=A0AAV8XZL2_9CUCU|nr:hypothetical protein NQ318_016152 [Aromia moschata]